MFSLRSFSELELSYTGSENCDSVCQWRARLGCQMFQITEEVSQGKVTLCSL